MFLSIIVLMLSASANAICSDGICEATENKENCCIDCGCVFGEECIENSCVQSIAFFSFGPEISLFLLILIILLAAFVIGYGLNIVKRAHKRTHEHFEKKFERPEIKQTEKIEDMEYLKSEVIDSIKKGKTIHEIKKELTCRSIHPELLDDILLEIIDSLVNKAEQGILSVDWDPRIVECVFKEVMKKHTFRKKRKKIHHKKKRKLPETVLPISAKNPESVELIFKPEGQNDIKVDKTESINKLENFVGIGLARGYSTKQIKEKLVESGWNRSEIDKLIDKIIKGKN